MVCPIMAAAPQVSAAPRRVLIVGAGPVGLAAAACLARFGIESLLIERGAAVGEGSRAICLSRRSLEILDWIGVASPFVGRGLGWTRGRAFHRDRQVHELVMPHTQADKFPPMTNLQQYYMEEFLAAHCRQQPLISLHTHSELTDLEVAAEGVVAVVTSGDSVHRLSGAYLVAADGARSTVRKRMRLSLEGTSFTGRYLIADIHLRSNHPTERRAWFDPPSNPGSTVLMHRQPEDIWRIDYQLQEGADAAVESQPDQVRSRVQRHLDFIGEQGEWKLLWSSIYSAHALALDRYVHGRVLFAGDAAHLVPIFGVRGLNSGFADAHNLAWKLAWVLRGEAPAALLDTYSDERRNATLDILRQAEKTTRFMTPTTRGACLMREAVLSLATEHDFVRPLIDPRQSVPYTYRDSELNTEVQRETSLGDGAGVRAREGGPAPGAPLPNIRVHAGGTAGYLLDWIGTGFTAILFVSEDTAADFRELAAGLAGLPRMAVLVVGGASAIRTLPCPVRGTEAPITFLEESDDDARRLYDVSPGTLYLARPDGHVCARWNRPQLADITAALRRACALELESRTNA